MIINTEEIWQCLHAIFLKLHEKSTDSHCLLLKMLLSVDARCRKLPSPRWCLSTFLISFSFLSCNIFHGSQCFKFWWFGDLWFFETGFCFITQSRLKQWSSCLSLPKYWELRHALHWYCYRYHALEVFKHYYPLRVCWEAGPSKHAEAREESLLSLRGSWSSNLGLQA